LFDIEAGLRHVGSETGVNPYSDPALCIKAYQIVIDGHITEVAENSLEPYKCFLDDINRIFQGQMLQVTQSQWDSLGEDP
jgi:hypothetical protein